MRYAVLDQRAGLEANRICARNARFAIGATGSDAGACRLVGELVSLGRLVGQLAARGSSTS